MYFHFNVENLRIKTNSSCSTMIENTFHLETKDHFNHVCKTIVFKKAMIYIGS